MSVAVSNHFTFIKRDQINEIMPLSARFAKRSALWHGSNESPMLFR